MRSDLTVHFLHRKIRDAVFILEEGNLPHPRCPRCDILVPWEALNGLYTTTAQYANGAERKRIWVSVEDMRASTAMAFHAYSRPMTSITSFKYLGRIMTTSDDDWPAVVGNPSKARKIWLWLSIILGRYGVKPRVLVITFKVVVQAVFIFGSETWVMIPHMGCTLGRFQHMVVRWIAGGQPWRILERIWEYHQLEMVMKEAGFEEVDVYVTRSQNTVTQYIMVQPILDLCEETVQRTGTWVAKMWWEKDSGGINRGGGSGGYRGRSRRSIGEINLGTN